MISFNSDNDHVKDYWWVNFGAGVYYYGEKRYDKAISQFMRVLELNPNCAQAYTYLGQISNHQKQSGKAIEYYRRALSVDPENITLKIQLCKSLLEKNEIKEATRLLSEVSEASPRNSEAIILLGDAAKARMDYVTAKSQYEKGIELDRKDARSIKGLAEILIIEGKYHKGLSLLNDLHESKSDDAAHVLSGNAHRCLMEFEPAVRLYQS